MNERRFWAGIGWRVALAMVISLVAFQLLGSPLVRVLDLPISALNVCLPGGWQSGFAGAFRDATYCWPRSQAVERFRYVRVGTAAWSILLCAPLAVAAIRHRRAARRGRQR